MFFEREDRSWTIDDLLGALGNQHDREILAIAQQRPVDAQEIMELTGFPKSTVYRRLRELETAGLLISSPGVVRNGHAVDRYRCPIEELTVRLVDGHVEITWATWTAPSSEATEEDRPRGVPPPIEIVEGPEAPGPSARALFEG